MWCLNPLLPTAILCYCVRWAFTGCHASFRWESWGAGKLTVRAGWQDPSLCGQWPWREMKEVHVHTLAAQTGLQSSVKALLPGQPCCFSSAPFLHPLLWFLMKCRRESAVLTIFLHPLLISLSVGELPLLLPRAVWTLTHFVHFSEHNKNSF